jgi:hypothetical protein
MEKFLNIKLATNNPFKKGINKIEIFKVDKMENKEYENYLKWKNEKKVQPNFTLSEVEFAKQFFEILEDYPSLKNKITQIGSKVDVFREIQHYLKEKSK